MKTGAHTDVIVLAQKLYYSLFTPVNNLIRNSQDNDEVINKAQSFIFYETSTKYDYKHFFNDFSCWNQQNQSHF